MGHGFSTANLKFFWGILKRTDRIHARVVKLVTGSALMAFFVVKTKS
jgi:hypothetical protein